MVTFLGNLTSALSAFYEPGYNLSFADSNEESDGEVDVRVDRDAAY